MHVVAREDGVGVVAAVVVDVGNRLIHIGHHLDADDRRQVFLEPVLLGGVLQLGARHSSQDGLGLGAATHLLALGGVDGANLRQKLGRHATRHEQAFAGVAGAVFLGLGVVGHLDRHGDVARVVHIGVAVAVQVLDDGHLGFGAD